MAGLLRGACNAARRLLYRNESIAIGPLVAPNLQTP
jgi:hypothetical protein